jgi:hypothetical protein
MYYDAAQAIEVHVYLAQLYGEVVRLSDAKTYL